MFARLCEAMAGDMAKLVLKIPHARGDMLAALHRDANILHTDYEEDGALLTVEIQKRKAAPYEEFVVKQRVRPGKKKTTRKVAKKSA